MNIINLTNNPLRSRILPSFKGDMSKDDINSWNSNDFSTVYMNLQSLVLDLYDLDRENNRNFLHYILKFDNPAIVEELSFRLQTFDRDELEKFVNQTDKYGKKPLDYCKTQEVRRIYANLFKELLGNNVADYNEAVRANYMPVSNPVTTPTVTSTSNPTTRIVKNTTEEIILNPPSDMVGNELSSDVEIPVSDDLGFDFDVDEDVIEEAQVVSEENPINKEARETSASQIQPVDNVKEITEREFETSPINLDEIIGLDKVKDLLKRDLIEPLRKENLNKLNGNNLKIENGFLFYGPPGCGKSSLITAITGELGLPLNVVENIKDIPEIKEKANKRFKENLEPTLVFIDNLDEKIKNEPVEQTADIFAECAKNGVILLAATNKYDNIDERAIRVGSFDQHIEVPLPNYQDRIKFIKYTLKKSQKDIDTNISEDDIKTLAKGTSGFSFSALAYIINKGIKDQVLRDDKTLEITSIKSAIGQYAKSRNIGQQMDDNPTSVYDTYLRRSLIDSPKSFEEVAGMKDLKEKLHDSIVRRLQPDVRKRFEEAKTPLFNDGFLFYGPPGCGKTFIVEALAGESKLPLYKVDKSVYDSSYKGESVEKLKKIFEQLYKKFEETGEYSILFFDEADSIFPKRGSGSNLNDEETNTMLQYLNNCTRKGVIPILATNFLDKIDSAVLRTGRVGTHIEIPTPDFEARKEIFNIAIKDKDIAKGITDKDLIELANMLEGFTSSDISYIAKNTIDRALLNNTENLSIDNFKQVIKEYAKERDLSTDFSALDKTTQFDKIKKRERIKSPRGFVDVAGMETIKQQLKTIIIDKLNPEVAERYKRNNFPLFTDGIMLYGKPGNGKTFIVEALAGEAQLPLYKINKSDYDTSLKGEAGNNIVKIFKQLETKFEKTGEYSLLFFDEAESIFAKRGTSNNFNDEELTLLLQYLNNAPSRGIIPILATNHSEKIDPAVIRSGRVGTHIEITSPDFEARKSMFAQKIKGKEITKHITDDDIASIARMLNGFCAADINHLTMATIEKALNNNIQELTIEDFKESIKNFSHERNMPEVNERNITSQYDTILKRTNITSKDPQSLDDIGGMQEAKEALFESVIMANKPEIIALNEENGVEAPNGVLLYGPPGCGKTFIMKAVASQAGFPLYQMKMSEMGSSLQNQTSANIKAVFDQLKTKYEKTGEASLLFLDECDTFFARNNGFGGNSERNQDLNTLKEEMNNAGRNGIIIVAATNEIQNIDPAILRDGRFDTKILINYPDSEARFEIIQKDLKRRKLTTKLSENEDVINQLVEISEGLATVSIVTAITDFIRKIIANSKDGKVTVKAEALIEAMKNKVIKNQKLQKDIAERRLKI